MDDTMCGDGYDTLHILQCQFSLVYSLTESPVEMMVDGLDHKHTAEDVGHSAVPDYRVVADSGDAFNL